MNDHKTISFIVCGNGYGHFKRVLSVIHEFIALSDTRIKINLLIRKSLKRHYHDNIESKVYASGLFDVCVWDIDLMEGEYLLMTSADYKFSDYVLWGTAIQNHPALQNADVIVSDNHVLPVEFYPEKTILMGSFLWYDVLDNGSASAEFKKIIDLERAIVKQYKPSILCVEYMAMPELLANATPIFMPWFCDKMSDATSHYNFTGNVLVTAGGTEANDHAFIQLIKILGDIPAIKNIWLDSKMFAKTAQMNFTKTTKFTFKPQDFMMLDAVFCRPGIGSLTDSISYNIPIFAIGEASNKEMVYNCDQVTKYGIGAGIGVSTSSLEIKQQLDICFSEKQLRVYRDNISKLKTGGAQSAASYLYSKVSGTI